MIIRPFNNSDTDYDIITAIYNASQPQYPSVANETKDADKRRIEKYKAGRLIAEIDNMPVGYAVYVQETWTYHPQRFMVAVEVTPDRRKQGVGTALYDALMETIRPFSPNYLNTYIYENQPDSIRFAENRGYTFAMRYALSALDLTQFDATLFAERVERFNAAGYTIRTLADVQVNLPDWGRKLHHLINTIAGDVPSPEPHTWSPYDEWVDRFASYKTIIPEAYLIVFDGDQMIGLSFFLKDLARPDNLEQALTGTLSNHRRKGIATALKVRNTQWAKMNGYKTIETDNEENNPMYQINVILGYEDRPAELEYIKKHPIK